MLRTTLFLFFIISAISSYAQPLNGVYTIGGVSPDYLTFTAAAAALNTNGVNGAVTFNVRTGTYNEKVRIYTIAGADFTNNITFQSESGNVDDVILMHTHTSNFDTQNYTLYIDGADYLNFKNITVKANQPTPTTMDKNRVVFITNNSDNIKFDSNKLISWYTSDNGNEQSCIHIKSLCDSIYFINNLIYGGYVGLDFAGNSNYSLIENNTFLEQDRQGIFTRNWSNSNIIGNNFVTYRDLPYYNGIEVNQHFDSLNVSNNKIYLKSAGTGISVSYIERGSFNYAQVFNNSIVVGPDVMSATIYGIKSTRNDSLLIAHNSINIYSQNTTSYGIYSNNSDTINVINNQIINRSGGLCYYSSNALGQFYSNNNNLFNDGNLLANIDGNSYSTVNDIFIGEGTDEFSTELNPYFASDSILIPSNPGVFNTGIPFGNIPTDQFGTIRSLTTPDVGIYEGSPLTVDAGVTFSNIDLLDNCPGNSIDLYVKITNFGTSLLTSVDINYDGNTIPWTGSLNQFEESDSILVGTLVIPNIPSLNLMVWTENPNGSIDLMAYNDTLFGVLLPKLTGSYTIGSISSDFLLINDAVSILNQNGVCGPVIFNIEPGTYQEQSVIGVIDGASLVNNITFQSLAQDSSTVIWQSNGLSAGTNYVVQLNSSEYLNFRYLTFEPINSTYKRTFSINDGAKNITVSNNIMQNGTFYTYGNVVNCENITIQSNHFYNGSPQVEMDIWNLNYPQNGITIKDNTFEGTLTKSLQIRGCHDLKISGNTFRGVRSSSCIYLDYCDSALVIEKNDMVVSGNFVLDILRCSGTALQPTVIRNNFVSGGNSVINLSQNSNLDIFNNTLKNSSGTNGSVIYFGTNSLQTKVFNNVVHNSTDGFLFYFSQASGASSTTSDFNGFFTNDLTDQVRVNSTFYNLANWQSTYSQDNSSFFFEPLYLSALDLHMDNVNEYNGTGTPIPSITEDIDNEPRNAVNPDVGADEFGINVATFTDIQLLKVVEPDTSSCIQPDSIIIQVKNLSTFDVDSFRLQYWIQDIMRDSIIVVQTMNPGDTLELNLGSFFYNQNTRYDFKFIADKPNNEIDNDYTNNESEFSYAWIENSKIYQKRVSDCVTDVELFIKEFPNTSILWSNGSTQQSIVVPSGSGSYSVTVIFNNGCVINDTVIVNL